MSILDLNPAPAESLGDQSSRTIFTETDVTDSKSIATAISRTKAWIEDHTHAPLGGIVTCAGIGYAERILPKGGDVMDIENFDRVIAVNLRGSVDLIRQALPILANVEPEQPDGERGVIAVVSSVAAYEGQVGQTAYSASKGAIASVVLPVARELARVGIRVVGIAPGVFETGMTGWSQLPKGMVEFPMRMGKGEEFAALVRQIFENGMMNGTVVRLDAGARFPSRL